MMKTVYSAWIVVLAQASASVHVQLLVCVTHTHTNTHAHTCCSWMRRAKSHASATCIASVRLWLYWGWCTAPGCNPCKLQTQSSPRCAGMLDLCEFLSPIGNASLLGQSYLFGILRHRAAFGALLVRDHSSTSKLFWSTQ